MKKSSSELKSLAKGTLIGHYGLPIGAYLIITLASSIISVILTFVFQDRNILSQIIYLLATIIISLLTSIFTTGFIRMMLNMSREQETRLNDIVYCFSNRPDKVILLSVLTNLIILACLLPAIIVIVLAVMMDFILLYLVGVLLAIAGVVIGIIFSLSYSQVYFIYLDDPEKAVMDIMRESRELMYGNKGRMFYLNISFIGLLLLSVLTCYVGLLWLSPYMQLTSCYFYRELLGEI